MNDQSRDAFARGGFWTRVGTLLTAMARRSGCSVNDSPLPELREVGRDLHEWSQSPHGRAA